MARTQYSKAEQERRRSNLEQDKIALEVLVAYDYRVDQFSEWHFRINGRLDLWPTSRKWYDQKTMRKGLYTDLESFVKEFLGYNKANAKTGLPPPDQKQ